MPEETVTQEDEQVTPAEVTTTEHPAESEPVAIHEDAPDPEPETEPVVEDEPTGLAPERVKELVEATNLPPAAQERLTGILTVGESRPSEEEVQEWIDAEIKYVKAVTGSGKPNMPPTKPVEREKLSAEEVEAKKDAVNAKWLRTRAPVAEVTND